MFILALKICGYILLLEGGRILFPRTNGDDFRNFLLKPCKMKIHAQVRIKVRVKVKKN